MDVILTNKNLKAAKPPVQGGGGNELSGGDPTPAGSKPVGGTGPKAAAPAATADDFFQRLLKLVPAEVTAAYTVLIVSAAAATDAAAKYAPTVAIALCAIATIFYVRETGRRHDPPVRPHRRQYVLSVIAFLAWACSIRDPLAGFGWFIPPWILLFATVSIPTFGSFWIGFGDND